jgi:hypothetical protein
LATGASRSPPPRWCPIGESGAGAHDLLKGRGGDGEQSAVDEAVDFLRAELADGPVGSKDIRKAASSAGIAGITLVRARRSLGIRPQKTGFGGGWEWALPEGDHGHDHLREGEGDDHLRGNPHGKRDCSPSEAPDFPEGNHVLGDDHLRRDDPLSGEQTDWDDELDRLRREGKAPPP